MYLKQPGVSPASKYVRVYSNSEGRFRHDLPIPFDFWKNGFRVARGFVAHGL